MKKIITNESYRNDFANKLRELRWQWLIWKEIAENLLKTEVSKEKYVQSKLSFPDLCTLFCQEPSVYKLNLLLKYSKVNNLSFSTKEIDVIQEKIIDLLRYSCRCNKSDAIEMLTLAFDILPLSFVKENILKLLSNIYEVHDKVEAYYSKWHKLVHPSYSENHGKNLEVIRSKNVFRRGWMTDYYAEHDLFSCEKSLIKIVNLILTKQRDDDFIYDVFIRLAKFNIGLNSINSAEFKTICLNKESIKELFKEERIKNANISKGKILLYMLHNWISFSHQEIKELLDEYEIMNESTWSINYWEWNTSSESDDFFPSYDNNPLAELIDSDWREYIAGQLINAEKIDYENIKRLKKWIPLTKILSLYSKKLTTKFVNENYEKLWCGEDQIEYIIKNIEIKDGDILNIPIRNFTINENNAEFIYKHINITKITNENWACMFRRLKKKWLNNSYHTIDISSRICLQWDDEKEFIEYIIDKSDMSLDFLYNLQKTIRMHKFHYREFWIKKIIENTKTIADYDRLLNFLSSDSKSSDRLKTTRDLPLWISLYYHLFDDVAPNAKWFPESIYSKLLKEGKINLEKSIPQILPDCDIPNFEILMKLKEEKSQKKN